jgi:hypothetical protein
MAVRYDDFDWSAARQAHEAWWAGELDRPLVLLSGPTPEAASLPEWLSYIPAYGDLPIEQIVDLAEQHMRATWYAGDGYPYLFTNYGAGSMAAYTSLALGQHSEHGGVWFHAATGAPLQQLRIQARTDTPWFVHTDQYVRAVTQRIGDKTQITLPDLGGALDILASIRTTERLLTDLIDRPQQVQRLVQETAEAWWTYYEHFRAITARRCPGTMAWAPVWSPRRTYMFQSDFSYMISPAMFERFVVPELRAACRRVEHGFYHLDGIGQLGHLDYLLGIEALRGVQWVPGAGRKDPCQWPEVFKKILASGKRIQTWASPDEVLDVIAYTGGARGIVFQVRGLGEEQADGYFARVCRACKAAQ